LRLKDVKAFNKLVRDLEGLDDPDRESQLFESYIQGATAGAFTHIGLVGWSLRFPKVPLGSLSPTRLRIAYKLLAQVAELPYPDLARARLAAGLLQLHVQWLRTKSAKHTTSIAQEMASFVEMAAKLGSPELMAILIQQ
jgi:hypothetical protein